ncbi:hypothetical protein ZWY2020_041185 [Hordeum vulgare]|nr:hypothetical protein ZWY2020_041185 [Hordeum vulgare]
MTSGTWRRLGRRWLRQAAEVVGGYPPRWLTMTVDQFRLKPIPYKDVQLDINISPHLSSEYISYLENPVELLNEAAKAAEQDIWNLMQFTEGLRRQYGKEPRDMELLLKKLYVRRMAADLGISRIYPSGKMIIMKTNMNRKVYRLMEETMACETHRNSLSFTGKEIKCSVEDYTYTKTGCPNRKA